MTATGIAFAAARRLIQEEVGVSPLAPETLALSRCHGRILAEEILAPRPLPGFANSAMDGFALRHSDLGPGDTLLTLAGEQFAGPDLGLELPPGHCARITTGAPLPVGADTVVMKEHAGIEGTSVRVEVTTRGAHVRHAGEDVEAGTRVFGRGDVLTPARVALAAALGIDSLMVSRRPTVAVFTCGDELVEPGLPLEPGQIHDSNRELLMGLLRAEGLEPTAWPLLPDDPERISVALRDAGCAFDLIVTCGAVSVGEKDHIPAVLAEYGNIHFWKVRMKPGMPVLFASLDQARVLALPGNPVSVLATWLTLGRTLADAMQGRTEPRRRWVARLVSPVRKPHERLEFMRGRLGHGESGMEVEPSTATGSHRLRAAADADALLVVPEGVQDLPAGSMVEVLPL